jgi:hypothetical protein
VGAPVVAAYAAGQMFYFVATGDNTGAVTLNIDSLGAKAVTRDGSVALAAGDIKSGEVVVVVYDGTRFQVVSQLNSAGNATFANVSITSALNVGGVATFSAGTAAAPSITTTGDTNTGIFFPAADTIAFTEGGVEAARFDSSGNLGIGTASPGSPLTVKTDTDFIIAMRVTSAGTGARIVGLNNAQNAYKSITLDGQDIQFAISGVERARLDSSGNLGLGVTPSAWSSGKAYETTAAGHALWALSNEINVTQNAYFNSGWKYGATAAAARYQQQSGEHKWHIAASGTAGNTISFTQAMTLDASGNLGIGTSSPGTRLKVNSASATNGVVAAFENSGSTGAGISFIQAGVDAYDIRMPAGSNSLAFYASGTTERARITSGGVVSVNTTGAVYNSEKLAVLAANNSLAAAFKTNAGATEYTVAVSNTATSGDNLFIVFATESTDTARGSITYNRAGGLVAYNVTSDYRAKDIIGPVQNSGAIIDALKVYEGQMKGATQSRPMLVAHEAQEHAPYAVTGEKDAVNEDGTPKYQQMDVSALVPLLLAEIQSLRARVAQLETK